MLAPVFQERPQSGRDTRSESRVNQVQDSSALIRYLEKVMAAYELKRSQIEKAHQGILWGIFRTAQSYDAEAVEIQELTQATQGQLSELLSITPDEFSALLNHLRNDDSSLHRLIGASALDILFREVQAQLHKYNYDDPDHSLASVLLFVEQAMGSVGEDMARFFGQTELWEKVENEARNFQGRYVPVTIGEVALVLKLDNRQIHIRTAGGVNLYPIPGEALGETIYVGRDVQNTVRLMGPGIAPYHAVLQYVMGAGWEIRDMNSLTGIRLHGVDYGGNGEGSNWIALDPRSEVRSQPVIQAPPAVSSTEGKGTLIIHADDLTRFSTGQRDELFKALFMHQKQLHLVIYNHHGQLPQDAVFDAILKLKNVFILKGEADASLKKYQLPNSAVLHLSQRPTHPQEDFRTAPLSKVKFVRLKKQIGEISAASLYARFGGNIKGMMEEKGEIRIAQDLLNALQEKYLPGLVAAYSA